MAKPFDTISSEILSINDYWNYRHNKYILPNGRVSDYYFVESRGSVHIIPIIEDDKFIMVKQFRYLNKSISIEFPGGSVNKDQTPSMSALSELQEETGYKADNLMLIGEFNPCIGITDEICSVFTAKNLIESETKNDESEKIEIIFVSSSDIDEMIKSNIIWNGMTIASWCMFNLSIKNK